MAFVRLPPTTSLLSTVNSFNRRSELKPTLARVRIAAPVVCLNVRMPLWSSFLPPRYIYSSDIADVDPLQLSELWAKTLELRRDPVKIMKSLKHSYAVLDVQFLTGHLLYVYIIPSTTWKKYDSDRVLHLQCQSFLFTMLYILLMLQATICDVAVDPAHQRRGIGRKIVKYLAKAVKRMGGAAGFAVFPPPLARRFFWMIGFRSDKKFYFMVYRGKLLDDAVSLELGSMATDERVKL